ncbi:MAG: LAGLIDADG family homing endonuclease, partial [Gemmataceae bacterium]
MSVLIPETELPQDLTNEDAVEAAYCTEMVEVASKLNRGLPTLIECDKDLTPFLYLNVRNRLRAVNLRCIYLDGRPRQEDQQGPVPMGLMGTMIAHLREAVRGAVERRVVVLPHLDLLTTSQGGLTGEAREVITLLYENPDLVWLGFKDPSFQLPKVIENLFPYRTSLLGINRTRLRHLVTRKESRKFGQGGFNPWGLYKYVSGINAVRLRKLLSTIESEDYPSDPKAAYKQVRQATLDGTLEVPTIAMEGDIGGYVKVKDQIRNEVLNLLARKESLTNEAEIKNIEELIPKGMIFWGPPGTGKTLFAKAMASEIGAAVTVVSGPELKSKWVGESLPWEEEVPVVLNGQFCRMPIGQLVDEHRDGDDVWTWTAGDEGQAGFAPVTGFIRHKGPDYIDILTTQTGRQIRVTGGHSLFVEKDGKLGEVFAEEVVAGETRVAVPLRLHAPETVRELPVGEMLGQASAPRDRAVAVRAVGRPAKTLPGVMPLTEDLGEFLGMWTAEGCYVKKGVRLSVHEDEAGHFEALCQRLFGHVTVYRKKAGGKGVDLIISHRDLRRLMEDGLGMVSGSRNKRVPGAIYLAPKPVVAAFLRGYFQGDGTFSGKYVEATTVSKGLAGDVLTLMQYFGIAARLRKKPERTGS